MSLTYIVDDQDPAIEYLCPVNRERVHDNYLHDTYTTIAGNECGGGWFKYTFNGTSVRVSNRLVANATYAVQVNISPMLQHTGNGIWESPPLSDERENSIVYAVGNQSLYPAFDFLTVTAGQSTQLRGKTIIVDDTDSEIQYSGNWRTEPVSPSAMKFDYTSSPYLNTTHWSNTVGDSVTYSFEGTSVAVYGVIPASNTLFPNRNVTATYAIDGQEPTTLSFASESGLGRPIAMSQLFLSQDLLEGKHTLVLKVTDLPDLSTSGLGLDFITYNASFNDLSSAGKGPTVSSGALSGGHGTLIWQPVLGALLGFIALLLGVFGWLWWRKRKHAKVQQSVKPAPVFVIDNWKGEGMDEKTKNAPLTAEV
ncbi:hypothetical protein V5O48_002861 [Marasmius crinis-equi]|uniref:Uncharacterized protein n=1 Tax=Marasmius crinis-equi TaxID=585013 RepID=A0ABR3FUY0_9AGAR